jgi:hypothetical protein
MVINCDFYEKNKVVENVVAAVKNIFFVWKYIKIIFILFFKNYF